MEVLLAFMRVKFVYSGRKYSDYSLNKRRFAIFFLFYCRPFFIMQKKYRKKVRKSDRLKRFILNFAANF